MQTPPKGYSQRASGTARASSTDAHTPVVFYGGNITLPDAPLGYYLLDVGCALYGAK